MVHLHDHMARQHLRISHSAIDRIDGPTRDPGSFQALQPLGPGTGHKDGLQQGHELVDMVQASGTGHKACLISQLRALDGVAQGAPELVPIGVDDDMDILGLKGSDRHG